MNRRVSERAPRIDSRASAHVTDPAVDVVDLTVRYGPVTAVDSVSFQAHPGEILGLLGPNGAGKTSVIRALTTIVDSTASTARVAGLPLDAATEVRRRIGVLPESNGYPGAQTARSYLRFYGQLFGYGRTESASRAERLLHRMGIGDVRGPIGTFSRGMRQRLGLARALINDPQVLFLDEPTLGLDPAGKEDILAQLTRSAVEDGMCVILCSHLLDEVERVCDRVAIMHRSQVVALGPVDDVIAASGVAGYATVRVLPDEVAATHTALRCVAGVTATHFDNTTPGDLRLDLAAQDGVGGQILRGLLGAGIAPRAFDLQGARLSDAFLALTPGQRREVS